MKLTKEQLTRIIEEELQAVLEDKIKGADGKACWKGYRYAGTEDGKDKCVEIAEETRDTYGDEVVNRNKKSRNNAQSDFLSEEELEEKKNSKCTKVTKKTSSTRKGKKWMKCVKSDSGGYKRIHWGQAGVRVTGKSGNTKRKKSFKARHNCSKAKSNTPQGQACKDWAEE